jgi:hypothetical protein
MELPTKATARGRSGGMDNALKINRVKYSELPRLAMVNKRHNVTHFFDKTDYTNADSEMVCKLISSTEFINPANCYLRMTLKVLTTAGGAPANDYYLPRSNGAAALFEQVYISTRDGTQIELIQQADVASRAKIWSECTPDYLKNYSQVAQVETPNNTNDLLTAADVGENLANNDVQVLVPLYWLCGVFSPDNDLLPPQLTSNMRIRLTLNRLEKYLYRVGAAGEEVKCLIQNAVLVTDNFGMAPEIQKAVMVNSSTDRDGLTFSFHTCFGQQGSATSSAVDEQVNKSVGLASKVRWIYQDHQSDALPAGFNTYEKYELQGTGPMKTTEQRVRLGDLYWHVSALQTTSPQQSTEFYHNTVYSCNKTDCRAPAYPVPYRVWKSAAIAPVGDGPVSATDKYFNYNEQTLERSDVLESSGLPINSGRALVISNKFNAATAGRIIKSHLYYTSTLNIFPTNIIVNL